MKLIYPEQHYQILWVSKLHCSHCYLYYLRTSLQRYTYLCLPLHRSRNFSNKPNKKEINMSLLVILPPLICKFSNCGLWQRIAGECTLERNHRCYNFKKDTYKTSLKKGIQKVKHFMFMHNQMEIGPFQNVMLFKM